MLTRTLPMRKSLPLSRASKGSKQFVAHECIQDRVNMHSCVPWTIFVSDFRVCNCLGLASTVGASRGRRCSAGKGCGINPQ